MICDLAPASTAADAARPRPLRFDLHCHSRFSFDGITLPEDMLTAARARGLHGFAITDHDTCEAVRYFRALGLLDTRAAA